MRGIVARRRGVAAAVWLLAGAVIVTIGRSQAASTPPAARAAHYAATPADDAIAKLQKKMDSGALTLAFDARHGYLESVLKALDIQASSQTLVFSKTSFQIAAIAPWRPRALYFNNDVYVGWVQGGQFLEVASVDKNLGTVFYTLDQEEAGKPAFRRQGMNCLQCHQGSMTQNVPGLVLRSVYADSSGAPLLSAANYLTTMATPFAQRWGGWYVSGTAGAMRHMGNLVIHAGESPEAVGLEAGANLEDLSTKLDTRPYLSPGSDLIALMVLAHQTEVHNLITRANEETRDALAGDSAQTAQRVAAACEPLVRGLLSFGEAPLPDPVKGSSTFAADFARRAPRDKSGRSLCDFDLKTRLFKYPCSYLIYSESFAALPAEAKACVYQRLWEIYNGGGGKDFAYLSAEDRESAREILRATATELPAYWR